jgi:hypothetical protein
MINETLFLGGQRVAGFGLAENPPPQKHLSTLITFPDGGAVIGGLIGYCVKRDAHGSAVGALVGAATPFALAAVILASGWRP